MIWLFSLILLIGCSESDQRSKGGDFELKSAAGPVRLSDFKGQWLLIYFGYTHCPDICPTALNDLAQALRQLPPEQAEQIQPIFISIDPERDHPDQLAEYAHYFYPRLIGLTAEPAQLKKLTDHYGAYFRKVPLPDSNMDYAMDHSSGFYWVDPQGHWAGVIQNHAVSELIDKIRSVLKP